MIKKPKEIIELEVSYRRLLPPSSFKYMMMFGKLFINKKNKEKFEENEKKGLNEKAKNHEMIHVKQAVNKKNSWLLFYLSYFWMWLKNLPLFNGFEFPYKFIAFEMEAFYFEDDMVYIKNNDNGCSNYQYFDSLSLKEKKRLYNEYKEMKKEKYISYHNFLKLKFSL